MHTPLLAYVELGTREGHKRRSLKRPVPGLTNNPMSPSLTELSPGATSEHSIDNQNTYPVPFISPQTKPRFSVCIPITAAPPPPLR